MTLMMSRFQTQWKLAILMVLMSLVACGHVPVSSMIKLRNLDLLETDITRFYAAVRLPDTLAPRKNGVVFQLKYTSGDGKAELREQFVLQPVTGIVSPTLQSAGKPGFDIKVFKVAKQDEQRMVETRARLKRLRSTKKQGSGEMSIDAATCRRGPLPSGPLYLSTYINSAELQDFVVLVYNLDIRKVVGVENGLKKIPLCQMQE
jgi:hypothetical protein